MLKNISSLGTALKKTEQESINGGGFSEARCNSPYFIPGGGTCNPGDYPHPVFGHCACCVG